MNSHSDRSKVDARALDVPHPSRLSPAHPHFDAIVAAHASALAAEHDGYLDPQSGLFVLTAAYHLKRGHCCGNGCRHCPFVDAG